MLPGFQDRLTEQILRAVEDFPKYQRLRRMAPRLRFLRSVFMGNTAAWVGGENLLGYLVDRKGDTNFLSTGSLLGALKTVGGKEIQRDNYLRDGTIHDWATLKSDPPR